MSKAQAQPPRLDQLLEDIERKRHKKNPFDDKWVQLCHSRPEVRLLRPTRCSSAKLLCPHGQLAWWELAKLAHQLASALSAQEDARAAPAGGAAAGQQEEAGAGREAVEAAVTNVHVRVEVRP